VPLRYKMPAPARGCLFDNPCQAILPINASAHRKILRSLAKFFFHKNVPIFCPGGRAGALQVTLYKSHSSLLAHRARVAQSLKSVALFVHASLRAANSHQLPRPHSEQNRRKPSSHFTHRRREGRIGRHPPASTTIACQKASRHEVSFQVQALTGLRATCPAQAHFAEK